MGIEPTHLCGEGEMCRCAAMPFFKGLFLREAVEAIVDLYGVEMPAVEVKPFALRQILRIEEPLPVLVVPAAGTDAEVALSHVSL